MSALLKHLILDFLQNTNKIIYFGAAFSLVTTVVHYGLKRLHGDKQGSLKSSRLLVAKILWMLALVPWFVLPFFSPPLSFAFNLVGFVVCGRFITARLMRYGIRTSLTEALASLGEFWLAVKLLVCINSLLIQYLPWLVPTD